MGGNGIITLSKYISYFQLGTYGVQRGKRSETCWEALMKKFRVLLVIACLIGTLTGCGKEGTTIGGKTVLNLALREGTYSEVVKSCLADFEEEHQVTCHVVELSEEDLHNTIAESKDSPGSVDLCMVDGSWMAEFTTDGILTNLSDCGYILDSDIIPATTEIAYHEGSVYLAPYYGNVTVLMYNRDLLQAAGYNASGIHSLSDVTAICQAAQAQGKHGFLYRGDTNNNLVVDFLPILLSFGSWVVDEDNQPILNDEYFTYAMTYYQELTATGAAMEKGALLAELESGEAAMAIGWPGWYAEVDSDKVGFCALTGRSFPEAASYNSNVYGIWTLGVAETSRHKELSVALLEYLMDPEVQKATVGVGGVPCRYSTLTDPDVLKIHPDYEAICTALESGQYRPIMSNWDEFLDILGGHMKQILNGDVVAEEGLQAAQAELEQLTQ